MKLAAMSALLGGLQALGGGAPVKVPAPGLELGGRLFAPEGDGPFPAIVLLHGCSGMWGRDGEPTKHYQAWAKHFQKRGFVALLLDSFGPRGEREICTEGIRKIHPARERAPDAHAALAFLAARPDVRRDSVHLLGWSNGGIAVLHALAPPHRDEAAPGLAFRSAVAFYPNCLGLVKSFSSRVPLLILAGAADDWTPARTCEEMAASARERGVPIEIEVYEGAHHAFDGLGGRVRFRPEVRNMSSPTGRGAHVGRDAVAQQKSWTRTTEFVEKHR